MHLTRGSEYGIRGVLYLAHQGDGKVKRRVAAIAEAQGIPSRFLAKIFQMLSKAGVLKSHRGIKGGFSLARSASAITMMDVIEAIEGPISLCRDQTEPSHSVWKRVQEALIGVLSRNTLADLVEADSRIVSTPARVPGGVYMARGAKVRNPTRARRRQIPPGEALVRFQTDELQRRHAIPVPAYDSRSERNANPSRT